MGSKALGPGAIFASVRRSSTPTEENAEYPPSGTFTFRCCTLIEFFEKTSKNTKYPVNDSRDICAKTTITVEYILWECLS